MTSKPLKSFHTWKARQPKFSFIISTFSFPHRNTTEQHFLHNKYPFIRGKKIKKVENHIHICLYCQGFLLGSFLSSYKKIIYENGKEHCLLLSRYLTPHLLRSVVNFSLLIQTTKFYSFQLFCFYWLVRFRVLAISILS